MKNGIRSEYKNSPLTHFCPYIYENTQPVRFTEIGAYKIDMKMARKMEKYYVYMIFI